MTDNYELGKSDENLYIIIYPGTDEAVAVILSEPVEFLEEVFRYYLTNWLRYLPTEEKEKWRKTLLHLVSTVQSANQIHQDRFLDNALKELDDVQSD